MLTCVKNLLYGIYIMFITWLSRRPVGLLQVSLSLRCCTLQLFVVTKEVIQPEPTVFPNPDQVCFVPKTNISAALCQRTNNKLNLDKRKVAT